MSGWYLGRAPKSPQYRFEKSVVILLGRLPRQPETALRAAIVADLDVARQGLEEHRGRLRQALDDGVKDADLFVGELKHMLPTCFPGP